jgi:hypothetical protein
VPNTRLTDLMMFNSANLGALIVKQKAEVKSWDDNTYNIQSLGIDEQYGDPSNPLVRNPS